MRQCCLRLVVLLVVTALANSAHAVTRSCETSNHHLIGTLRLADGSIRENVVVPFHGVEPVTADGSHWLRPPMARRAACENASREAVAKMQQRRHYELAMTLCDADLPGITGIISVLPKVVGAEAWHGSENNWNTADVPGKWQNCDEREAEGSFKVPAFMRHVYPNHLPRLVTCSGTFNNTCIFAFGNAVSRN